MSWIQKLYETYEQCAGAPQFVEAEQPLLPVSHTSQNAHIEIAIDGRGNFVRASAIQNIKTIFPATEKSMTGRTSGGAPYPLCEKIQYCAADYPAFGGGKKSYFMKYAELLSSWCNSAFSHPKAGAVYAYICKGTVVADLVREKILHVGSDGILLTSWEADTEKPDIFKNLTAKEGRRDQGDAFVRWRVEIPGEPLSATWEDRDLMEAWIHFETSKEAVPGLCLVTGKEIPLAIKHPAKIRNGADKAKLISSNDLDGFTFRGRFENANQVCGVGSDVTQKAHNALRWLIGRQAFRNGDQVVMSWATTGTAVPPPLFNTYELFEIEPEVPPGYEYHGDVGQAFALRLAKLLRGYHASLGSTNEIVVMGLDSATDGRMAITFYRELSGSEFLERIQSWHENVAWHQYYSKDIRFVGAPSPKDIAEAAYGRRLDENLRKSVVERLLPCIIDGHAIPRDIVESVVRRTCNRAGLKYWEWEKNLGIACALFKGYFKDRSYQMTLETNRTTRDYLYGRLLAIAEHIEGRALHVAGETRDTTAAKLMQRFADRPYSTWRTIELSLNPYKTRLRAKRPSFIHEMEKRLDEVVNTFSGQDFMNEQRLSGEFLLGYHCQRQALWVKPDVEEHQENADSSLN